MMATAVDPFANLDPTTAKELASFAALKKEPAIEKAWPEPSPLPSLLPEAPGMPKEIIPAPFRDYVADISDRMQVAMEIPAVSIIAALSSIVGRSIAIHPKRNDDWVVVPNLWGLVAARSGMLKSPAIEEATRPLQLLAAKARKQYELKSAERKIEAEIVSARLAAGKKRLTNAAAKGDESDLQLAADELLKIQQQTDSEKVAERRYRINDATTEKLLELMADNPRGLFVYRDELSGFLRSLDKVGREMDRAFYLESWNGYGSFTTDRIGRGTTHVDGLCLSIFGGIQPARLQAYVGDALNSTSNDDGLIQRFQLAVYPETPKSWNLIDRTPDSAARNRAARIFDILDSVNPAALGVPSSFSDATVIHFNTDAQDLFDDWLVSLQQRLLSGDRSPSFESHLAKYRSLMPSLAILFHLADWADGQMRDRIPAVSIESARLAALWTDYLELHARKIYAGVLNPDLQAAHLLLKKIEQGKLKKGNSIRDIYRNQWTGLQTKEQVAQGLQILMDHDYLRLTKVKGDEGRPASDIISINPKVRSNADGV
jgi:hypothetical protein